MELEDRIKPALSIVPGQTLSSEEFQEMLSQYLEENGIVDDLRAHLRTNMIRVLTYTSLGKSIMQKKQTTSPKLNALNLLIAEYFLHRNYYYTLSVMSSEVPLDHSFPPMSINDCKRKDQDFCFASKDLWDIFEAFGITRVANLPEKLSIAYRAVPREPMLICILQNMSSLMEKHNVAKTACIKKWLNKHNLQSMDLDQLVKLFQEIEIDMPTILQVIQQLEVVITNEVKKLIKIKENELAGTKRLLNYETTIKLQKFKAKFASLESHYKNEKIRLEMELQQTKDHLQECTMNVQAKCKDINDLNEQMKRLEERLRNQEVALRLKENSVQQRQAILEYKQDQIDKQFEMLRKLTETRQDILIGVTESKQTETKDMQRSTTGIDAENLPNVELCHENDALKKNVKTMEGEMSALKDQNLCYQSKIQDLLNKTNSLMAQLETRNNDRVSYSFPLSPRISVPPSPNFHASISRPRSEAGPSGLCRGSIPPSQIPWTSTFGPRVRCSRIPSFNGGGEEGSTSASPQDIQAFLRETRRKKSPRTVTQESSSEDITPTEDILNEAKERLLQLERESTAIDNHYQQLQRTTLPLSDSNAACFMNSIQNNVAILRDGLSKIFGRDTKHNMTRENSIVDIRNSTINTTPPPGFHFGRVLDEDELEKQAMVEFEPAPVENNRLEEEAMAQFTNDDFGTAADNAHNSTMSSGMVLNTSISTIDISQNNGCSGGDWLDID